MNKKKRLLVFHPALAPYRIDFFNSINESFKSSFYFYFKNVPEQEFDQNAIKSKCFFKINYLIKGFSFIRIPIRFGILTAIKNENPDIIFCSEYGYVTFLIFLYKLLFKQKFKLYIISDDSIVNSKKRKGIRHLIRVLFSKKIDGIIFPSEEVCNWYNLNVSQTTRTINMPIMHEEGTFRKDLFNSLQTANENLEYFNLFNKKILLFVGRLVEEKNLPFLLEVVSKLKSNDWVLIIVGGGFFLKDLKIQISSLNISDKVFFIGRKEGKELYSWYTISHIFVLPSTYEQFGAVVNEALLAGCYVLCSEMAGASTLINEHNGRLFNPYDKNDLHLKLEQALNGAAVIKSNQKELRTNQMSFTFTERANNLKEVLNDQ